MMKNSIYCAVTVAALTGACANDTQHDTASTDELSTQVAFYGLTVMDCQQQATQCAQNSAGKGFLSSTLGCSSKLTRCLAKASAEAAKGAMAETREVAKCGTSGAECVSNAQKLSDVLACQNSAESCVVERVKETTGIALPTSQQVIGKVVEEAGQAIETTTAVVATVGEAAGEVVATSVDVADHVVGHATEVAEQAVGTAVRVADHAVDHATNVAEHVVETTAAVTGEVVGTAVAVVDDAVDTTLGVAKSALQCAEESRTCIKTTKKLLSCQLAYASCMTSVL
jgi:hypothetical protein